MCLSFMDLCFYSTLSFCDLYGHTHRYTFLSSRLYFPSIVSIVGTCHQFFFILPLMSVRVISNFRLFWIVLGTFIRIPTGVHLLTKLLWWKVHTLPSYLIMPNCCPRWSHQFYSPLTVAKTPIVLCSYQINIMSIFIDSTLGQQITKVTFWFYNQLSLSIINIVTFNWSLLS